MILYGASLSPFVRKVMVFGSEKGLKFDIRPPSGPEFEAVSPFRKMPAFKDGDFEVSDSSAIVAYLDVLHPEPNLIPTEARARARTVWWEEFADTIVMPCGVKIAFNRLIGPRFFGKPGDLAVADEAEKVELPKLLDYLEAHIPVSGFLVEDRFTLADISVASPFVTLGHADCKVDAGRYPKIAGYLAGIWARPSFARLIDREKAFLAA